MKLPNFLLVGAAKSGTTALYSYLRQHPDIFMPAEAKEPMFLAEISNEQYDGPGALYAEEKITSLEDYRALFNKVQDEKAIGEASVPYLYYYAKTIPNIIKTLGQDTKIIVVLRNPIERAYSNYLHHVRDGLEPLSFEQALDAENERFRQNWWWGYQYREGGRYLKQVEAYIHEFGKENVHIELYEDLKKNPHIVTRQIFEFLNVNADFLPNMSQKYNVSTVPKSFALQKLLMSTNPIRRLAVQLLPKEAKKLMRSTLEKANSRKPNALDELNREKLTNEFKEEIILLQDLLGRDLSHWISKTN